MGEPGQMLQHRSAASFMSNRDSTASEMGAPVGLDVGSLVDVARLSGAEQGAVDALPEASRIEALALFQELSTGLFAVRELLAQYNEQVSRAGGAPPSLHEMAAGSEHDLAEDSNPSAMQIGVSSKSAPSPRGHHEPSSFEPSEPSSPVERFKSASGNAALDRARKASAKPGGYAPDAKGPWDILQAEEARDAALAALAAERAARLAREAQLRELGAEVPEFQGADSSSGLDGVFAGLKVGETPPLEKQRSAGEMMQNGVAGAMAAAGGLFSSILPKPDSPPKMG